MKKYLSIVMACLTGVILFNSCNKNTEGVQPRVSKTLKTAATTGLSVSPASSIPYGAVTITGSGFDAVTTNNIVKFNGVAALVNTASATQLVVTVPAAATTGALTVTVNGVTTTATSSFKILSWVLMGQKLAYMTDPNTGARKQLTRIATGKDGALYGLVTLSANSHIVVKFAGTNPSVYYTPAAGHDISCLAVDSSNNVITTFDDRYLIKINQSGVATRCSDTIATPARDLATDAAGNIYVANQYESVLKVVPSGAYSVLEIGDFPGPLAVNSNGDVFFQVELGRLSVFTAAGKEIFIRDGERGDGGMACDKANNLFIADYNRFQIRNTAGYFSFYNLPNWHSYSDLPISITFDNFGHVYCLTSVGIAEYAIK